MQTPRILAGCTLLAGCSALAQSTISPVDHFGHAANAGWIDFRPDSSTGVVFTETYLSGRAYAANIGWIDFGDGSPENGHTYANNSSGDFGVNLSATGELTGYAYAANIGWIVFEQSYGKPRLSFITGQLSGHAYAANAGWISLQTSVSTLTTTALAQPDSDADGIPDAYEQLHAGNLSTLDSTSDHDGDGSSDLEEYLANTDPLDADSRLRITGHTHDTANSRAVLIFTTRPNRLYAIQHQSSLTGNWADSGLGWFGPDPGTSTVREFLHPGGAGRFFRVAVRPPLQP